MRRISFGLRLSDAGAVATRTGQKLIPKPILRMGLTCPEFLYQQ